MIKCPKCTNSDERMIEKLYETLKQVFYLCNVCSKSFVVDK